MARRIESNDMVNSILSSTELLIARDGLQNLSIRSIAKEMGIASGTLYLYFKTKDDLLKRLAAQIYERYNSYIEFEIDPSGDFLEQYRELVRRKWLFFSDNPMIAVNMYQYQAMLGVDDIINAAINDESSFWNRFVNAGKKQGVIIDLPNELLYVLSIGSIMDIAYLQQFRQDSLFEGYFEEIILRTWKAMTL